MNDNLRVNDNLEVAELPTIVDYLELYAEQAPEREVLVDGPRRVTYREALSETRLLARAMIARGVGSGDRIAVYSHPHADTFLLFLAAASIGAIFLGNSPKQKPEEIGKALRLAHPKLFFFLGDDGPEEKERLKELLGNLDSEPTTIDYTGAETDLEWESRSEFRSRAPAGDSELSALRAQVGPRDPVAMVFTSGSTGTPKGALLVNAGVTRSYAIQARRWCTKPPVGVADLPTHHLGFIGDNCCALMVPGGTIHILRNWSPEKILDLIKSERLTFWWTQTTMILLASRHPSWRTTDFSSLERIGFGGAPIPSALREALLEKGVPLGHGYGMTEVHGNATYAASEDGGEIVFETIGKPHEEMELTIRSEDGMDLPDGEPGEILLRGNNRFGGYLLGDGSIDSGLDEDGWYHTRDLGVIREDGNAVLIGRVDDMFKSGGFNIFPREVEQALEQHHSVVAAAVISVDDPTWSKVGHAYVLTEDSRAVDDDDLREFLKGKLANYKVPKKFTITSELPMLPSGKIDKKALRESS